jgi:hypothetical protein
MRLGRRPKPWLTEGETAWVAAPEQPFIAAAQEMILFVSDRDWDSPTWTTSQFLVLGRVAVEAYQRALDNDGRGDGDQA